MTLILRDGKVYEETTKEKLVDVDALKAEKAKLEESVASAQVPKTQPDQETLDCWNDMLPSMAGAQARIDRINERLAEIDNL